MNAPSRTNGQARVQHDEMHALGLLAREHAAKVQGVDEAQVEVAIAIARVQLDGQAVAARDRERAQQQVVDELLLLNARHAGAALALERVGGVRLPPSGGSRGRCDRRRCS